MFADMMPHWYEQNGNEAGAPRPEVDRDDPKGKRKKKRTRVHSSDASTSMGSKVKGEGRTAPLAVDAKVEQRGPCIKEEREGAAAVVGGAMIFYTDPDIPAERAALIRRLLESQEAVRHLEKAKAPWGLTPAEYKQWFDAWYVRGRPTIAPWLMAIREGVCP